MTKINWIIIVMLLLGLFLHPYPHLPAAEEDPGESKKKETRAKRLPITMFIPGIYQLKTGQYVKGGIFLAAFIGSVAGALIHNKKGNDHYNKYLNSTNVEEIILLREKTGKSFKKRNLYIVGIFSTWVLHIIDVKFFKSGKAGVKGEVGKNNITIGFYYRF
jgi:hypothetical protein